MLDNGECNSLSDIARLERKNKGYIAHLYRLNYLAPDIVEAIVNGTALHDLSLADFKSTTIPDDWNEQRKMFRVTQNEINVSILKSDGK